MRITLFDNHDSFTWNLAHDLEREGVQVTVVRDGDWTNDLWGSTDALVLSPGPGLPEEHPQLQGVIEEALKRGVPVLGVCLGMQALALHFGARLQNLEMPLHGRATEARWSLDGLDEAPLVSMWENAKNPLQIGHYHSWIVDESSLPEQLHVNARNSQGLPMAFLHRSLPVAGVQFHPESVLTPEGQTLLQGWISAAQRCLAISASNVSLNFS